MSQEVYTDILIIGGGIVGCASAYYLARRGHEVLLLERKGVGMAASGANAGGIAQQGNHPAESVRLAVRSILLWQELDRDLGPEIGFSMCGELRVSGKGEDQIRLEQAVAIEQSAGCENRIVQRKEALAIQPHLSAEIESGSFCATDGFANPHLATLCLARAAISCGAKLRSHTEVVGIEQNGVIFTVETQKERFKTNHLVLATGAWTKPLAGMIGVQIPQTVRINQIHVTEPISPVIHVVLGRINRQITIKQSSSGNILIGGGWQGTGDIHTDQDHPSQDSMIGNLREAIAILPFIKRLRIIRSWCEYESRTPDRLPIVDLPNSDSSLVITACSGFGFTQGPALGLIIADLIGKGDSTIPWKSFQLNRFQNREGN